MAGGVVGTGIAKPFHDESGDYGIIYRYYSIRYAIMRRLTRGVGPMQVQHIHHVAIICSDYARSRRFYTEVLGGTVIAETYRAERDSYKLDLQLGAQDQIELFSFPHPPPRPSYPEACGLRHLALAVADVAAVVAELGAAGMAVEP